MAPFITPPASEPPPAAPSHRVMLVDDQAMVAEAVRRMVANAGDMIFHYCADPTRAIKDALAFQPTVLLLDLLMPDLDGLTLLRFLRASPPLRQIPIVMLSVREEPESKVRAFTLGANDYLIKLPQPDELLARLRYHSRTHLVQQERDAATSQLRASQERFRRLAEAAFEGIALCEAGIVRDANPALHTLFGYEPGELNGLHLAELVDPDAREAVTRALAEERSPPMEVQGSRRDGTRLVAELRVGNLGDGAKGARVAALRDITGWKRMERELRELKELADRANHAKSIFLATMSHEIRTPINVVIGITDLLRESGLTPEQRNHLEMVGQAGETLLTLINDILDLSKIEAGQIQLERVPFPLEEVVRGTVEMLRPRARQKGLALQCQLHPQLPPRVLGDPVRLRQVLLNLLGNAIKFTEAGQVGVEVWPDAPGVLRISVHDTGIGIPPPQREEIFHPFTQAEASTTRRFGGTGLGLAICRRLVDQMGGRIWVEDGAAGGSVFRFLIQAPPAPAESREPPEPPAVAAPIRTPRPEPSRPGLRILLVDDADDNRYLIRAFLKGTPHTVVEAVNGAEAVELWRGDSFDLVLMDVQMPIMDGYEATRTIRTLEGESGTPPIPILALSAHALKEDTQLSLAAGCNEHVTKPIRRTRLLELLERYGSPNATGPNP